MTKTPASEWIQTPGGNLQLTMKCKDTGKEFCISYQDFVYMKEMAIKGIEEYDGDQALKEKLLKGMKEIHERVTMNDETALINEDKDAGYLILKGDHRKEYEDLETYDECVKYFNDNEDKKHNASD